MLSPLVPVLAGLLGGNSIPTVVDKKRIKQALQLHYREIDNYLHQILAMHRLAREGEPRLAIVGCVTAIEWFMNSLVNRQKNWSLSIRDCLKDDSFTSLPEEMKSHLRSIAETRNRIVHGEPLKRDDHRYNSAEKDSLAAIGELVQTGLKLYREVNRRRPSKNLRT